MRLSPWPLCPTLSGMDVARKVVILARECGLPLELNQLRVESLVPEPLAALPSVDEYMEQLPQVRQGPPTLQNVLGCEG